jgi:hypothetical protein
MTSLFREGWNEFVDVNLAALKDRFLETGWNQPLLEKLQNVQIDLKYIFLTYGAAHQATTMPQITIQMELITSSLMLCFITTTVS